MNRKVEMTEDGSATIFSADYDQTYHSRYGAIAESRHIFIDAGLRHYHAKNGGNVISIFEMGFGTGLNALLTYSYAKEHGLSVYYEAIELLPLKATETALLNYPSLTNDGAIFTSLHNTSWDIAHVIDGHFTLKKDHIDLLSFSCSQQFNIIYYDAFSPNAQPELWTGAIFKKMYDLLLPNGILTTYCSKGIVQRALRSVGFTVEKMPGPKGKKEIIRGVK